MKWLDRLRNDDIGNRRGITSCTGAVVEKQLQMLGHLMGIKYYQLPTSACKKYEIGLKNQTQKMGR